MCKFANKRRKDVSFQLGEWVYPKLSPHVQETIARCINAKLAACFYGPYMIISKVGAIAYKLQLLDTCRVHPVFHVS